MSNSQAVQIKLTLSDELYGYVKSKAEKFGLSLAAYVRHLVINDVKDVDIPEFKMSAKRERLGLKALEDYRKGKTRAIENWDEYFDSL